MDCVRGRVGDALIQPARWWSPEHTFSGNSANLTLDAMLASQMTQLQKRMANTPR